MSPILSAAVVLWRQNPVPQVYLARRVPRMRFFGNVFAFCGGRVDPVDRQSGSAASPEDPRLGSLRSTAVRELIEELGIDLRDRGAPADPRLRAGLLDGSVDWAHEGLPHALNALGSPCLRLVTPGFYPRRFDTGFFLAEVGPECAPDPLAAELDSGAWETPTGWLDRWQAGEFHLAPPALLMLRVLATHGVEDWARALREFQVEVEDPGSIQEVRLDPAVRLLPLRTPTLPPATHTNAYLVGHQSGWLVDPAAPAPDGQELLARTLEGSASELAGVLLTHDHPDHTGAAEFVAQRFGVPILGHAITAEKLRGRVRFDRTVQDGERLQFVHSDGERGELVAVFTPGHAEGHLCFHETRYGGLIAGDMVSTLSSILVDPADGDMGAYMKSLEHLAGLPVQTVYPAHGPPDSRGTKLFREQIGHREAREAAVRAIALRGPIDLADLTEAVWDDVPRPMLGYARKSAVSILRMLVIEGAVSFDGERAGPPGR